MVHSNISIEELQEGDWEETVTALCTNFINKEPLCKMLSFSPDEMKTYLISCPMKVWLKDRVSVVARDKVTKKVVGCLLGKILDYSHVPKSEKTLINSNAKIIILEKIIGVLKSSIDFVKKYKVQKIYEVSFLSVDETYAGKGIGKDLITEGEKRGKANGCQLAIAQATNISSQKIFHKLGYTTEFELNYRTLEIGGRKVLDLEKSLGTYTAKVMAHSLPSLA